MEKHYIDMDGRILNPLQVTAITMEKGKRTAQNDRRKIWYNRMLKKSNKPWYVKFFDKNDEMVYVWSHWIPPRVLFWHGNKIIYTIRCKSNAEMKRVYEEYVYLWNYKIDRFAKDVRS
jgi:hypothetical protein